MKPPIYEPAGKAKEYGDLALNIYDTCNHGCAYCYAKKMYERFHGAGSFCKMPEPRKNIIVEARKQLEKERITGETIFLSFTCDPYPAEINTSATREIIRLLKEYGNHVQILTKRGKRAERDFDLLDENDWFGVTYCGYDEGTLFIQQESEPFAAPEIERLASLSIAHKRGIKTWMSIEPVLNEVSVLNLLEMNPCYIDRYKIGKMNYHPSAIDWKRFGTRVEQICISNKMDYYIKDSLRKEMQA